MNKRAGRSTLDPEDATVRRMNISLPAKQFDDLRGGQSARISPYPRSSGARCGEPEGGAGPPEVIVKREQAQVAKTTGSPQHRAPPVEAQHPPGIRDGKAARETAAAPQARTTRPNGGDDLAVASGDSGDDTHVAACFAGHPSLARDSTMWLCTGRETPCAIRIDANRWEESLTSASKARQWRLSRQAESASAALQAGRWPNCSLGSGLRPPRVVPSALHRIPLGLSALDCPPARCLIAVAWSAAQGDSRAAVMSMRGYVSIVVHGPMQLALRVSVGCVSSHAGGEVEGARRSR